MDKMLKSLHLYIVLEYLEMNKHGLITPDFKTKK